MFNKLKINEDFNFTQKNKEYAERIINFGHNRMTALYNLRYTISKCFGLIYKNEMCEKSQYSGINMEQI